MEVYDLLMVAVIVFMALYGAWKGLAWQLASLAAVFVSYLVAYRFRVPVSEMISTAHPWNIFLAMLILYVGTSLFIWLLFRFVSELISRVRLNEFDSQIGALFGCFNGVVICVIATLFSVTLLGAKTRETIVGSRSGYYIAVLLDKSHTLMPEEIHEVLHPFIHQLDVDVHDLDSPENGNEEVISGSESTHDLETSAGGAAENRSAEANEVKTADGSSGGEVPR